LSPKFTQNVITLNETALNRSIFPNLITQDSYALNRRHKFKLIEIDNVLLILGFHGNLFSLKFVIMSSIEGVQDKEIKLNKVKFVEKKV